MRATSIEGQNALLQRCALRIYIGVTWWMLKTRVIQLQMTEGPNCALWKSKRRWLYTWGAYVITTWKLIANVTKTVNREWVTSTGNGKMNIRTRKRIVMGNEFTDRARVQVSVPIFIFPFHWSFPVARSSFFRHSKKWIDVMLPSRGTTDRAFH